MVASNEGTSGADLPTSALAVTEFGRKPSPKALLTNPKIVMGSAAAAVVAAASASDARTRELARVASFANRDVAASTIPAAQPAARKADS